MTPGSIWLQVLGERLHMAEPQQMNMTQMTTVVCVCTPSPLRLHGKTCSLKPFVKGHSQKRLRPFPTTPALPGSLAQGNPYKLQLLAVREQGSERFCDQERGEGGCIHRSSFLIIRKELAKTVSTSTQGKG